MHEELAPKIIILCQFIDSTIIGNSPALFRISPSESTADTQREMSDVYLPATRNTAAQVLSLPVHPALSKDDLSTIVREVVALCN